MSRNAVTVSGAKKTRQKTGFYRILLNLANYFFAFFFGAAFFLATAFFFGAAFLATVFFLRGSLF